MPTSGLSAALRRRWYVVVAGLLVTACCGLLARQLVPVGYEARALVVLLPPVSLVGTGGNPYLALGGLDAAAAVAARAVLTDETVAAVARVSPGASFGVDPDLSTAGPVLLVLVEGETAAGTLAAVEVLLAALPKRLRDLQDQTGAPPETLITTTLVTKDAQATTVVKPQVRAFLVVGAGGAAATLLAAAALDGLLLRRRPEDPEPPQLERVDAVSAAPARSVPGPARAGSLPRAQVQRTLPGAPAVASSDAGLPGQQHAVE